MRPAKETVHWLWLPMCFFPTQVLILLHDQQITLQIKQASLLDVREYGQTKTLKERLQIKPLQLCEKCFILTMGCSYSQVSPGTSPDGSSLHPRMTLLYQGWMTLSMLSVHLASSVSSPVWYFQHQEFSLTLTIVSTHLACRPRAVSFGFKGWTGRKADWRDIDHFLAKS